MRRFFLEEELPQNLDDEFRITGDDARHISRALRLTAGDEVMVVGSESGENKKTARAVITEINGNCVTLKLKEIVDLIKKEPPLKIWLAQGMPKGDKMDFIVQKAVELGVFGIIPTACEHCVVRYDPSKEGKRRERWRKIAREAAKQCGRSHIPDVMPVMSLIGLLEGNPPGWAERANMRIFMLYEGEGLGLKSAIAKYSQGSEEDCEYLLIVGPEGGFSAKEVEFAKSCGAGIVSIGPRILRTETASLSCLSILMYEFGDLG